MEITEEKKDRQLPTFYRLLLYFFIYSCMGWILETLYAFCVLGHFSERGFLFGPLCPIYGYGALILILLMNLNHQNSLKIFVYAAVICSILEYLASFVLEAIFGELWWDYSQDFFNLNGRISIFYTFAWGIIAILFSKHIHPFFEKYTNKVLAKIPTNVTLIVLNVLFVICIVDTAFSAIQYLR